MELILLAFVWDETAYGTARSTKRVEADLLLAVVWDKTASGTARSSTENELNSLSLLLVFVWDETASGTARRNIAELSCLFSVFLLAVPEAVLSHTETRSRSAVQSIPSLAPRCPRGSLVPYQSEEHQFCGALLTERTVCGMGKE